MHAGVPGCVHDASSSGADVMMLLSSKVGSCTDVGTKLSICLAPKNHRLLRFLDWV